MRPKLPAMLTNLSWSLALGCLLALAPAHAAQPEEARPLSAAELEALVGPVALYPDDLLALVLPAATYPLQVVQAARFLEDLEENPDLVAEKDWDESVIALLNYPDVLKQLNDDLDWTWELGQAVLHQEAALIDAVDRFRKEAHASGNLTSDEYQRVSVEDGAVRIRPSDPQVLYVPYYEPADVHTYVNTPAHHYYSRPYPVYYYPYPAGHHFGSRPFWGVTSVFSIGWQTRHVHYHLHQHRSHPYYGHSYAYHQHRYWRPRNSFGYREHPARRYHPGNRWRTHGYRQDDRHRYERRDDDRARRPSQRQPDAGDRQRREQQPVLRQQEPSPRNRQWRAGTETRGRAAEIPPRQETRTFRANAPRQAPTLQRATVTPRPPAKPAANRPSPRTNRADGGRARPEARQRARQAPEPRLRPLERARNGDRVLTPH